MQVSVHKNATSLLSAMPSVARPATSSGDGAGHEQEPQVALKTRPSGGSLFNHEIDY
jgi:hypothetical protein